jgi:hypothetical protein
LIAVAIAEIAIAILIVLLLVRHARHGSGRTPT